MGAAARLRVGLPREANVPGLARWLLAERFSIATRSPAASCW